METPATRTEPKAPKQPKKPRREAHHTATVGRARVPVYKRTAPNGSPCFMVANYSTGKRRFDSYADEGEAVEAALKLARQMSQREVLAAAMTNGQASEYAASVQKLAPFNVGLLSTADAVAECLKLVGGLADMQTACRSFAARNRRTERKAVAVIVAELLTVKEGRGASIRYIEDLRGRLNRFAADCRKDCCDVTTADVQAWLDGEKLGAQSYANFRRVLHLLFEFAVSRGFAADNPVAGVERVKVRGGETEIFTPGEMVRLLGAASPEFLPSLAIGAFAGLRSAEIERLEWSDIHLTERHIVVSAGKSKTASRRIVPVSDNLAAWLASYAQCQGNVWNGTHQGFYDAQQDTAAATGTEEKPPVKWKSNALRHSYASYRFAQLGDAGRVAGELGNSAAVVHRHYRELVKPADAEKWFALRPATATNVLPMPAAVTA